MKTITLTSQPATVADLLTVARKEVLLLRAEDGNSFVPSQADEFKTEVR
jgi:hypothetical protein